MATSPTSGDRGGAPPGDQLATQFCRGLRGRIAALAAVREALGSDAEARATARGLAHALKGSGGTYGFPEISAAAAAAETAPDERLGVNVDALLVVLHTVCEAAGTGAADHRPAAEPAGAGAPPRRLLVVDDDPDITRLLKSTLAAPDRAVDVADSAASLDRMLGRQPYDLIVLDLMLPDADGRTLLADLRQDPRTADVPIVVLSGLHSDAAKAECFALGADTYVEKPFSPIVVAAAVGSKLERAPQAGGEASAGSGTTRPAATPEPAAPAAAPARPVTVLLAEDDDLIAAVVKHRLEREGMVVEHFRDGMAAFEAAPRVRPAVAILDVKMPGMDGFELLGRLRADPAVARTPVLMLTAMGDEHDIVRGLELGANEYMVKPFSPVELVARVRRLLAGP